MRLLWSLLDVGFSVAIACAGPKSMTVRGQVLPAASGCLFEGACGWRSTVCAQCASVLPLPLHYFRYIELATRLC